MEGCVRQTLAYRQAGAPSQLSAVHKENWCLWAKQIGRVVLSFPQGQGGTDKITRARKCPGHTRPGASPPRNNRDDAGKKEHPGTLMPGILFFLCFVIQHHKFLGKYLTNKQVSRHVTTTFRISGYNTFCCLSFNSCALPDGRDRIALLYHIPRGTILINIVSPLKEWRIANHSELLLFLHHPTLQGFVYREARIRTRRGSGATERPRGGGNAEPCLARVDRARSA